METFTKRCNRVTQRWRTRFSTGVKLFLTVLALNFLVTNVSAQIVVDGSPNDWKNLFSSPANAFKKYLPDPIMTPDDAFTNGSSDEANINTWGWNDLGTNDKTDIKNAGIYYDQANGKLYFFADRIANNGDAAVGIWILQNNVDKVDGGTFSGTHAVGDILVISHFVNGGSVDDIKAYRWNGTGLTEITNLVFGTSIFAAVNNSLIAAPSEWAYTPKAGGSLNQYPANSFFEGFIDLNLAGANGSAFPLNPCTARFLIETRNSQSTNAALGDFVLGSLATTPSAVLSGGTAVCAGNGATLTITGTPNASVTYSYTPGGSPTTVQLSAGGTYQIMTGALNATRTYNLVSINDGLCTQNLSSTAMVEVNQNPAAPTGSNQTVCANNPVQTLTAAASSATPGATITWYTAASGGSLVANPTLNSVGTVTYYAQANLGNCVSATRTPITLTINATPAAPTGNNQTVCAANPIQTLTATASSATAGATISWFDAASGGNAVANPTLNSVGSVTYYAQANLGNCSSARTAITLTINATPAAPTGSNQSVCAANPVQTLTASASSATAGATISWFDAASGGNAVANPTLSAVGTVTYYAQATLGNCVSARTPITLTISQTPAAPTGSNQTVCANNPVQTLTAAASSATPGATITWYTAASGGSLVANPTLNSVGTVTYYAQANLGNCVSARTPITLTINATPAAPTGNNQTVCAANPVQTLTASASSATAGATITWWTAASGGSLVANPTLNSVGTVTYFAQATLGDCSSARTPITLTINATPAAPTGNNQTVCAANPVQTLTASASSATVGATISWFDAASGGNAVANPTLNSVGTVTYYAQATLGNCVSARTPISLTINATPAAPTGNNQTVCAANPIQTLTASASSATPGATIVWYDAASGGNIVANPTRNTVGSTTYYAQANLNGCSSARTPITLTINATPAAPTGNNQNVCAANPVQTLTASASSATAGATIVWYDAASGGNVVANPTLNSVGSVTYYAQANLGNCSSARTPITLTIRMTPSTMASNSGPVCVGGNLTLSASNVAGGTYSWTGPNGFISSQQNPTINGVASAASGTYSVTVTVNGCTSAPSQTTVVINNCAITYCTYTQGYYGNAGGKSCSPAGVKSTAELIGTAIANAGGELVIGSGGNTFRVAAGDIADLISRLPGGGPSAVLSGVTRPATYPLLQRGKIRNSLLSQTVVLGLNLHINWNSSTMMSNLGMLELKAGMMYSYARANEECGNAASNEFNPCSFESVMINDKVIQYLQSVVLVSGTGANKATVSELYALANSVLGGGTRPTINYMGASYQLTMEDISSVADAINNLFDGCRVFNGYDAPIACITDAVTSGANQETSRQSLSRDIVTGKVKVNAAPNPFLNRVRFTIESPVSGQGSLEVFNTLGQKVQTVFQGQIDAGTRQIDFAVPSSVKSNLIYVFRVGEHQVTGKLMNGK